MVCAAVNTMSTPYGIQISENCLLCKLRQTGFFCDLPKASLQELEKVKYASAYPQGAVLFVEGQAPRGVYVICSGRVKLSTTSRDGKTLILRIAQAGEVLAGAETARRLRDRCRTELIGPMRSRDPPRTWHGALMALIAA